MLGPNRPSLHAMGAILTRAIFLAVSIGLAP